MIRYLYVVALLAITSFCTAQSPIDSFIKNNHSDFFKELETRKLLDQGFFNSQYIFFGEIHGFAKPQEADIALIKMLNKEASVKYYIAEVDDVKAWMLNNYLSDGDETWLKKVFKSWVRDTAQWGNREYYDKFIKLRDYQKTLPEHLKIKVVGIDQIQDYSLVPEYLDAIAKDKKTGDYKASIDAIINSSAANNEKELKEKAGALLLALSKDDKKAKKAFKDIYPAFKLHIQNLTYTGDHRDSAMCSNLMNYTKVYGLENAKMYGFLGMFHCLQARYNADEPFAYLLKQQLKDKSRITSIIGFYNDATIMVPYTAQMKAYIPQAYAEMLYQGFPEFAKTKKYLPLPYSNNEDNPMMEKISSIEVLEQYSKPKSTELFKLTGDHSPFNSGKTFAEVKGGMGLTMSNQQDHTTDAFQYLVLFRNIPPATPLKME